MNNSPEFIAIGDIATDTFIKLASAHVVGSVDTDNREICLTFGDKIPYEMVKVVRSVGNSPNAAVAFAKLAQHSSLISDVGEDSIGKETLGVLKEKGVNIDHVRMHEGLASNSHYVLWYGSERTILVKHEKFPYLMPDIKTSNAWVYLSSLGADSEKYHEEILGWLTENKDAKLVFQPGTFQMKMGTEKMSGIYKRTELFFCNVQESELILKTNPGTDIKELLKGIHALGPKYVFITDGVKGAYAFDGEKSYFIPIYPQEAYERTGAGDAFASTVTVAIALGKPISEAVMWGPINSASVIKYIGSQEGLLSQQEILEALKTAPADYKIAQI